MTIKILDTFAGIGGFSYAAEKLVGGFKTTQFIEIDPYCQKVLKKHWPTIPLHDDIKTFSAEIGQFDIITGGFPCQDLSVAGRKAGITKESRSGLFYELMRIVCMVRPKFVVMENVAAILNNGLDIVLGELSQAGYDAEWAVISASSLGASHRRSRWWLVAYPNSIGCGGGSSERRSLQERQLLQSERQGREMGCKTKRCSINTSNPNSKRLQGLRGKYELQESSKEKTFTWRNSGITLNPNWKGYKSKPTLCRGDDGLSNRVHRLKSLGNSVVPQVAAIPLQRVKDLYY